MKKRIFKSEGHLTITEEKTQGELIIGGVRRVGAMMVILRMLWSNSLARLKAE